MAEFYASSGLNAPPHLRMSPAPPIPNLYANSSSLSSYAKLLYPHNDVRSEVELELGWVELRCFARWIPVAPPGDVCDCGFGDFGDASSAPRRGGDGGDLGELRGG